jgi:hypothetical protein
VYTDYSPIDFPFQNYKGHQVVVVEGGEKVKDVMRLARNEELTTRDADGDEIFWIVFADEPRRIWDFTGKALRQAIWSRHIRKDR